MQHHVGSIIFPILLLQLETDIWFLLGNWFGGGVVGESMTFFLYIDLLFYILMTTTILFCMVKCFAETWVKRWQLVFQRRQDQHLPFRHMKIAIRLIRTFQFSTAAIKIDSVHYPYLQALWIKVIQLQPFNLLNAKTIQ